MKNEMFLEWFSAEGIKYALTKLKNVAYVRNHLLMEMKLEITVMLQENTEEQLINLVN